MTGPSPDAATPSGISALLFDLDGTLADTAALNVTAYASALAEVGITVGPGVLERETPGRNWRQFLPPILAAAGSDADPTIIAERKKAIYGSRVHGVRLNDALFSLLATCHGVFRTALVTTASRANVDALIDVHAVRHHFDVIVSGDDVGRHKPDPEAYALAALRLGVDPSCCLAFEDSDIGQASAVAAGIQTLRVTF